MADHLILSFEPFSDRGVVVKPSPLPFAFKGLDSHVLKLLGSLSVGVGELRNPSSLTLPSSIFSLVDVNLGFNPASHTI